MNNNTGESDQAEDQRGVQRDFEPEVQPTSLFSPASYNLPQFKFSHLPSSEIRSAWTGWIRWFENVMIATNITDGRCRKAQLLAMGGIELQGVFYEIPGADVDGLDGNDPYVVAKDKLTEHFSPKQHESFERFQFWSMTMDKDEPIEKFLLRVQQKAGKCAFGRNENECRQIAVIDKVIQNAPEDLRRKLLEKDQLKIDDVSKIINAYQSIKQQASQMTIRPNSTDVNRLTIKKPGIPFYKDTGKPAYKERCSRCGRLRHPDFEKCPAIDRVCHRCRRTGHFQMMCKAKGEAETARAQKRRHSPPRGGNFKRYKSVRHVESREEDDSFVKEDLSVYKIADEDDEYITCRVGGVDIKMLIDSGSTYNLIDDTTWELLKLKEVKIQSQRTDSTKRFLAYGRVPLKLLTVFDAKLEIKDGAEVIATSTTFYVIEGGQQPLLGKLTARKLGLLRVGLPSSVKKDVNRVEETEVFPKIKDFKLVLPIDRTIPPVIQPLRRCPIPILDQVKFKLDQLLAMGIIERVTKPSSWVSPLVPIMKDNGELRLCVDMRRANQAIQRLNHPLPVFEDMLPRFRGARYFTTLDIQQAFHQVELAEESRDITTFITNWGLFRYTRLLFGVNYAPEFFQNLMESILAECENTVVFIDDIFIWGASEAEHDAAVKKTLSVLASHGLLLNIQKCKFKRTEAEFLGHRLSEKGVLPSETKVNSLLQCRAPRTKEELRSFLGLVTYVSRFLPDLATLSHPLRELLKGSKQFCWLSEHQHSFEALKQQLGRVDHLGYYDPLDHTILVTDASGVGLGAVLVQIHKERVRIISYASRSLSETEQRYPPIEKEALAIVWGVERFKTYLLGISFTLETDHRPLEVIFTAKSRPTARIERWMLRLQAFRFKVVYRKGTSNIADTLSRLASHVKDSSWQEDSEVYIRRTVAQTLATLQDKVPCADYDKDTEVTIRAIQESVAIDISEVIEATKNDEELQAVSLSIIEEDWTSSMVKQYSAFRSELSFANGLIMRGLKLVIPSSLRERMLLLGHEGHPGQTCMKRRLRDRCWWPNMDQDVVKMCEKCEGCRLVQIPDPPEPMVRRPLPDKAWVDIAIDFLGPLPTGEYILVVVDYFSRHVDLEIMRTITATETIKRLTRIFGSWGIPRTITLDNGKQFVATEFENFCKTKGIHLNHTTPYWPQANGEVERQNRSLLKRLKIANALYGDWRSEMALYLEMYNNTPHSTTGISPNELLQNRRLRFKFPELDDLSTAVAPSEFRDRDAVQKSLGKEREDARRRSKPSEISTNDVVLMRNLHPTNKLSTNFLKEKFLVVDRNGSNVRVQSMDTGKEYDRNASHLKRIPGTAAEESSSSSSSEQTESATLRRSERLRKPLVS